MFLQNRIIHFRPRPENTLGFARYRLQLWKYSGDQKEGLLIKRKLFDICLLYNNYLYTITIVRGSSVGLNF